MEQAILELINLVKSTSETLWSIAIHQVWVRSTAQLIWGIALGVLAFPLFSLGRKLFKKDQEEFGGPMPESFLTLTASLVFLVIALILLTSAAMGAANPEFYAIRVLLEAVR